MYETTPPKGMSADDAKEAYAVFLRDIPRFDAAISKVFSEWPKSCEHFLTNSSINRVAWIGQSSMCIDTGVPEFFKSGFQLLSPHERKTANEKAQERLDKWIFMRCQKDIYENGLFGVMAETYPMNARIA
jgi:hypothetical protein